MAPSRSLAYTLRKTCSSCLRLQATKRQLSITSRLHNDTESSTLPRIAQPSLWSSLIPKAFRQRSGSVSERTPKTKKPWNPAAIFFFLGILVGSNAIQIIGMRREMLKFSRQTDARLDLLREVVQRVKNGEEVDVKRALGTGDAKQEAEWEEVVKELESTDMLWEGKLKRDRQKAELQNQKEAKRAEEAARREEETARQEAESQENGGNAVKRPRFLM